MSLEPGIIFPWQLATRTRHAEAERMLWAAVTEQALDDLDHANPTIRDDAHDWFASRNTGHFSFVHIMHVFGFDVESVRAAALNGRRRSKHREFVERRNAQIRALAADGLTVKEIAAKLGVSIQVVNWQLYGIPRLRRRKVRMAAMLKPRVGASA